MITSLLPIGPSKNEQPSTIAGTVNVVPESQFHREVIPVTGLATTRNVVVQYPEGLAAGAEICVMLKFPLGATDGTTVNIYNGTVHVDKLLFTLTRADGLANAKFQMFANGYGGIEAEVSIVPAYAV